MSQRHVGPVALLAIIIFSLFISIASNEFVLDAERVIRDSTLLRDGSFSDVVTSDWWNERTADAPKNLFRPIPMAIFWLIHHSGGEEKAYNIVNVIAHVLTSVARYFFLVALLLGLKHNRLWAALAVLLWAWHGATAEAVVGMVGLAEIVAGLFSTLSFWATLEALRCRGTKSIILSAAAGIAYLAAFLSKESAAFAPIVSLALILGTDSNATGKKLPARLATLLPLIIGGGLGLLMRLAALGALADFGASGVYDDFQTGERILSSLAALGSKYLTVVFWPFGLNPNLSHQDIVPPQGFADLRVLTGIAVWIVLVGGIALGLKRKSPAAIGLLIAVAAYLPVANLLRGIGAIAAYRFLYSPLFGVLLALTVVTARAFDSGRSWRFLCAAILAFVGIVGPFGTVRLIREWRSSETLYTAAFESSPKSTWALQNDTFVRVLQNARASHTERLAALRRWDDMRNGAAVVPSSGKIDRMSRVPLSRYLLNRAGFISTVIGAPEFRSSTEPMMAEARAALVEAERLTFDLPNFQFDAAMSAVDVELMFLAVTANDKEKTPELRVAPVHLALDAYSRALSLRSSVDLPDAPRRLALAKYRVFVCAKEVARIAPDVFPIGDREVKTALAEYDAIDPNDPSIAVEVASQALRETSPEAKRVAIRGALERLERVIRSGRASLAAYFKAAEIAAADGRRDVSLGYYRTAAQMPPHSLDEAEMQKRAVAVLQGR